MTETQTPAADESVVQDETLLQDDVTADDDSVVQQDDAPKRSYELIVASTIDGWIGKPNGAMPFRQRSDLKQFKRLTTGHAVIMGRKTLESIGSLLPHRLNVIITNQPLLVDSWLDGGGQYPVEDRRNGSAQPLIVSSFEELERRLPDHLPADQKAFIIGGDSIYKQALEKLDVKIIWRTCVYTTFPEADTEKGWARFDLPTNARMVTERGPFPAGEHDQFTYGYEDYVLADRI